MTVLLDSTKLGVTTSSDGSFQLRLTREKGILVFSFVGYKTIRARFEVGNSKYPERGANGN